MWRYRAWRSAVCTMGQHSVAVKGSRFKFQGARLKVQVSRLEVRGWNLEVSGKRLEVKGSRLKVRSMLEVGGYIQDTHNRCIHPHASTYRCLTIPYTTPPAHLGPALGTHMPPSHLCTCACPHMPLKCLPHSVTACTDGHHMASHSAMCMALQSITCMEHRMEHGMEHCMQGRAD